MWGQEESGEGRWGDRGKKGGGGMEKLLGRAHCYFLGQLSFLAFEEEQSSPKEALFLPASKY